MLLTTILLEYLFSSDKWEIVNTLHCTLYGLGRTISAFVYTIKYDFFLQNLHIIIYDFGIKSSTKLLFHIFVWIDGVLRMYIGRKKVLLWKKKLMLHTSLQIFICKATEIKHPLV